MSDTDERIIQAINDCAIPLQGDSTDYDRIVEASRGKSFVLIGEASHGTEDFYRHRALITRRLIEEHGFAAVAVEADWPDAYAINHHVWASDPAVSHETVFEVFERFPTWMWANTEVLDFVRWLASFNQSKSRSETGERPVGFYGLDLYSMASSAHAVIGYLERHDPPAARRARERYACLDQFMEDPARYGQAVEFGLSESCEQAITEQLMDLQGKALQRLTGLGLVEDEQRFCVEQNARLVSNAEKYYRAMFRGRPSSWNLRDSHMFQTLEALREHLNHQLGREAGIVVWAHNSHIGNAAATEMGRWGEHNIGQLARESYGDKALLVGFSTAEGEVTAASDWDAPAERKRVRKPLAGSYESLFQRARCNRFMLDLREQNEAARLLAEPRLQRAIGVIYRPETERQSHYFQSRLPEQYDFMIHLDETRALVPLHDEANPAHNEPDNTYPSGM
ncbi:MAG TPA: erythromycin esterase family protein [Pseudomonas xinjiangensis]|uniref:Erythromycin esterase family protein n=2 Tax=root TaxID=1 RepID=A0A7V1FR20_9GAMM|nr:erythromycin esterase family protein [Halopseudomonas xinjiangensis]HEC49198.1 erythromycin esterase family protein [Halopseudomonas xinjiangensis]